MAARPDSVENPGFDVRRFNLPYWRKIERMLHYAREKDMPLVCCNPVSFTMIVAYRTSPHPVPLPIGWGEGGPACGRDRVRGRCKAETVTTH